jgi:hypothetical protein
MSGFTSTVPKGTTHNQGKTYRKHHIHAGKRVPPKSGNKRGKMKTS